MRSRNPKRLRRAAAAAAVALAVALAWSAGSARAEDDDENVPLDTKLFRQFMKDLGLSRSGDGMIEYRERAPLVVPPSRELPPPRDEAEQAQYDQLRVMPYGTWIEFSINQQGDLVRRRLSWYSPVTDKALFVNQRGQRVGEHSLDSVARMMSRGQAKIVAAERGRLVDRAWQATLNTLRSFAGRGARQDDNLDALPPGAAQ